jgi:hypothetical protein
MFQENNGILEQFNRFLAKKASNFERIRDCGPAAALLNLAKSYKRKRESSLVRARILELHLSSFSF